MNKINNIETSRDERFCDAVVLTMLDGCKGETKKSASRFFLIWWDGFLFLFMVVVLKQGSNLNRELTEKSFPHFLTQYYNFI